VSDGAQATGGNWKKLPLTPLKENVHGKSPSDIFPTAILQDNLARYVLLIIEASLMIRYLTHWAIGAKYGMPGKDV
jgi:hypothetical protein